MSDESIKYPTTTGNSSFSRLNYFNNPKFEVKLSRNCLKPGKVILYITFEIKSWPYCAENDFTLKNVLFGTVKLTKMLILISIPILDMVFQLIVCENLSMMGLIIA